METTQIEVVIEHQNEYRLAWLDTVSGKETKGTFLFNEPSEARATRAAVKNQFPTYKIWLEDRQGNEVAIPPR